MDLLEAMLQFDPRKRITVEQARTPCTLLCTATWPDARLPMTSGLQGFG